MSFLDKIRNRVAVSRSLRVQIGLFYTALALINIVFASVMIFENQTDLLLSNFKFNASNLASDVVQTLGRSPISKKKDPAYEELNATLKASGVSGFVIFARNGEVIFQEGDSPFEGTVPEEILRKTLELGIEGSILRKPYNLELNTEDFRLEFMAPVQSTDKSELYIYTALSIRAIQERQTDLYKQIALAVVWMVLFHILFGIFVYRLIFVRVEKLRTASDLMADGNLKARADWKMQRSDELDDLGEAFNSMAGKIEETIETITRLNTEIQQELEIGKEVQELFLPENQPFKDQLAMFFRPLREVSGDVYHFYQFGSRYRALFFADASGHGVSAALITTITVMSLHDAVARSIKPWSILTDLNNRIMERLQANFFATAVFFILDDKTRTLYYSNAGHNAPLYIRPSSGEILELEKCGPPLGMMDEVEYPGKGIKTRPGDRLLIYSDGLVETRNGLGEDFGLDRVKEILRSEISHSPQEQLEILSSTFVSYVTEYKDDVSIMLLELP